MSLSLPFCDFALDKKLIFILITFMSQGKAIYLEVNDPIYTIDVVNVVYKCHIKLIIFITTNKEVDSEQMKKTILHLVIKN